MAQKTNRLAAETSEVKRLASGVKVRPAMPSIASAPNANAAPPRNANATPLTLRSAATSAQNIVTLGHRLKPDSAA